MWFVKTLLKSLGWSYFTSAMPQVIPGWPRRLLIWLKGKFTQKQQWSGQIEKCILEVTGCEKIKGKNWLIMDEAPRTGTDGSRRGKGESPCRTKLSPSEFSSQCCASVFELWNIGMHFENLTSMWMRKWTEGWSRLWCFQWRTCGHLSPKKCFISSFTMLSKPIIIFSNLSKKWEMDIIDDSFLLKRW